MRTHRESRPTVGPDPFGPIETVVDAMLALFVLGLGAALLLVGVQAVSGHGSASLFSFQDTVCVSAPAGLIGIEGSDPGASQFPRTSARGSTTTDSYNVCLGRASFGEQVAASADGLLSFALVVGTGLLVRRAIRTARSVGLFTGDTARTTRRLGWFLVVLGVTLPLGARTGIGVVVAAAIPGQSWWSQVTYGIPLSAPLLITGLGVLSFARILRVAVPLQEEAALTV